MALVIDGKAIAKEIHLEISEDISALKESTGVVS